MDQHTNRLADQTSPYLLQHAHNPVNWRPWGDDALTCARELDRPILLSIGYSSCHWCHVMERESFEDEEIAVLMNENYVCIKVDREERPDLDHIYMTAVQLMTGQGGWPMTVFLTPQGRPFYGGTYFPPDERFGRPGFRMILEYIRDVWSEHRQEAEDIGGKLFEHLNTSINRRVNAQHLHPGLFDAAFAHIEELWDHDLGGFNGPPKFPQPAALEFLMRYIARTGSEKALKMLHNTLTRMAEGGIYDHLGGGFHRYSTDIYWLVPHFEKMLYDNALLIPVYLHAWQLSGRSFYRRIVEETAEYLLREMTDRNGLFCSSQDADSPQGEGNYYAWTPVEIEEELGTEDAVIFFRLYDVTPHGNWERKNLLNLSMQPEALARSLKESEEDFFRRIGQMRRKLLTLRSKRQPPSRDDKALASWNGLALAALAEAGSVLNRPDFLAAAKRCAEALEENLLRRDSEGVLTILRTGRSSEEGFTVSPIPGYLEDYAAVGLGMTYLFMAEGNPHLLHIALDLKQTILERFQSPDGLFYDTAIDSEKLIAPVQDLMDGATPSGNSLALELLLTMSIFDGDSNLRHAVASPLGIISEEMVAQSAHYGRMLANLDLFLGPVQELIVLGARTDPRTRALRDAAHREYRPRLLCVYADPSELTDSQIDILSEKILTDNVPAAWLCEDGSCRLPVCAPEALTAVLNDGIKSK